MDDYFEKVECVMSKKRITDLDGRKINETGIQISGRKVQLVVTIDPTKLLRMIDPDNRDYIISVECIGSASETISLRLFISGMNIL